MGFEQTVGLEVLEASGEIARGRVAVHDGVRQPMGLVHGGVYASIAESLATLATKDAVGADKTVRGLSTQTSFLRPIFDGAIDVSARPRHKGRTTWVWEADVTDAQGRNCALVRATVTIAASEQG